MATCYLAQRILGEKKSRPLLNILLSLQKQSVPADQDHILQTVCSRFDSTRFFQVCSWRQLCRPNTSHRAKGISHKRKTCIDFVFFTFLTREKVDHKSRLNRREWVHSPIQIWHGGLTTRQNTSITKCLTQSRKATANGWILKANPVAHFSHESCWL